MSKVVIFGILWMLSYCDVSLGGWDMAGEDGLCWLRWVFICGWAVCLTNASNFVRIEYDLSRDEA